MPASAQLKFFAQLEVIVDQELFALFDALYAGQPEPTALLFNGAIGITTMIDVACRTPLRSGVHVVPGIELDNMVRAPQ
jgi:hypothetical protein